MSLPPLKSLTTLPSLKNPLPPLPATGSSSTSVKIPAAKASPAKPTPVSTLPPSLKTALPPPLKTALPPLKTSPLPVPSSKVALASLPVPLPVPLPKVGSPKATLEPKIESPKVASPKTTLAPLPVSSPNPTLAPLPVSSPKPTLAPLPVSSPKTTLAPLPVSSPKPTLVPLSVSSPKPTLVPLSVSSPKTTLAPLPKAAVPKVASPKPPKVASPKTPKVVASPKIESFSINEFLPQKTKKDIEKYINYIDTFFGSRNGIYFANPEEGKNFTPETLSYMTSSARADELTSMIVERMNGEKIPFSIVECCAGIGGNTLSFLDNPNVSSVISFETDPKRREMLSNNIKTYMLEHKFRLKEEFIGMNDPSAVLFMDPPWLNKEIDAKQSLKEQYILSGIKLGEKTLEEWISSSSAALFVFKLPLGYKLKPIVNFSYEEIPSKKFLIIIGRKVDERKRKEEEENERRENERKRKEKRKEEEERKKNEEQDWSDNLKNFLRHSFLPRLNIPPVALDKLVSPDAMKIWEVAFTHESFNPNFGENYEELEISGDANLEMAYMKFITQSYPQMNRSQLSELRTTYLAKGFQSKLAMELGLGTYVRTRFGKTLHVYEDVLEAVFGALDKIGDMVFKFGAGAGLIFNLVVSLYSNVEIKLESTKANPKTQTKEIFERLGFINPKMGERVPETVRKEDNGKTTLTITIPPLGMNILKSLGIAISSPIIATYTSNTKKVASDNAYRIAVSTMNKLGVTRDFIDAFVKQRDLENPDIKPYVQNIRGKLEAEGFDNFYFVEEHVKGKSADMEGVTTGKYIQMIGVRPNGRKEILVMTDEPVENSIQGRQELLLKYKNL